MRLIQITPGAGGMYCGNCFRDNALVAACRRLGHEALMVPLYLPLRLDETSQSGNTPIFFGGISVYLEQVWPGFSRAPRWLRRLLARPSLLSLASGRAASTRAEDVGDLTLSMLSGEHGRQAQEIEDLAGWLGQLPRFDFIYLSNALLAGMARRLRERLGTPVGCMLQGEDTFLDALPPAVRPQAWRVLAERVRELDLLVAPSVYYAERMRDRLGLAKEQIQVIPNGASLEGLSPAAREPDSPVLGYFARMCPAKGLDTLVEAFILLRQRGRVPNLRLRVGGSCGPADEGFVAQLRRRLEDRGLSSEVDFCPNLSREEKVEFYRSLSVFSVPALYGEAFGLYLLEAWAAGLPVVQPRHAAFPELVENSGAGLLCEPGSVESLASAIEGLLRDHTLRQGMRTTAPRLVQERFSAEGMATRLLKATQLRLQEDSPSAGPPNRNAAPGRPGQTVAATF